MKNEYLEMQACSILERANNSPILLSKGKLDEEVMIT